MGDKTVPPHTWPSCHRTPRSKNKAVRVAVALSLTGAALLTSCSGIPGRDQGMAPHGFTFAYSLQNRERADLVQVFDDGSKTYLQFRTPDVPALTLRDESGAPLPFERSGPYAIVKGRHSHLVLETSGGHCEVQRAAALLGNAAVPATSEVRQVTEEVRGLQEHIAELEAQLAAARAQLVDYANRLVIHFANNSARIALDPDTLQTIADAVHDRSSVTLTGYTDANYPNAQGGWLAERRVRAVRDVLIEHGVAAGRLQLNYYSAGHFATDNHTSEGRELNRRVEIVSQPTPGSSQG